MKAIILGICLLSPLLAQAPRALAFEVATIKPVPADAPSARPSFGVTGDRYEIKGLNVRFLIGQAYGVAAIYVFGEDWLDTKFDLAAKLPEGASEKQIPEMLQTLLAERFGIRIHHETRQMPIYALTVAKGGLKMKELPPDTPDSSKSAPGQMIQVGTLDFIGPASSGAGLAYPLRNMTGLKGKYEMTLDARLLFTTRANFDARTIDDSEGLARVRQAVEPLGLEINPAKQPVEAIVVDHIEHTPKDN